MYRLSLVKHMTFVIATVTLRLGVMYSVGHLKFIRDRDCQVLIGRMFLRKFLRKCRQAHCILMNDNRYFNLMTWCGSVFHMITGPCEDNPPVTGGSTPPTPNPHPPHPSTPTTPSTKPNPQPTPTPTPTPLRSSNAEVWLSPVVKQAVEQTVETTL